MRKFITLSLCALAALSASAEFNGRGWYRVRSANEPTNTDYITFVNNDFNYTKIIMAGGGGAAVAIDPKGNGAKCIAKAEEFLRNDIVFTKADTRFSDPGTVFYFEKKSGSKYDFKAQGSGMGQVATGSYTGAQSTMTFKDIYADVSTGSDKLNTVKVTFTASVKVWWILHAISSTLGSRYFADISSQFGFQEEDNAMTKWDFEPLNQTDNYFSADPEIEYAHDGKKYYYTTLRTAFTYKVKNTDKVTVYRVDATPENGIATLTPYAAGDVIPAGLPVVIESTTKGVSPDNILVPRTHYYTTDANTQSSTVLYSNYGMPVHDGDGGSGDKVGYFHNTKYATSMGTLYKLGLNDKGEVGFWTKMTTNDYMDGNAAYSKVPCNLFMPETALKMVAASGTESTTYKVAGTPTNTTLRAVGRFTSGNDKYIVVTDGDPSAVNYVDPAGITNDNLKIYSEGNGENAKAQKDYTQNNWLLVKCADDAQYDLYDQQLLSITGTLTNKLNPTLQATAIKTANVPATPNLNTYCPANFMGNTTFTGTNRGGTSKTFFLMPPKPCELATITWAVAKGGNLYMPQENNGFNIPGAISLNWDYNEGGKVNLTDGNVYSFDAIVKLGSTPSQSAPRRANALDGGVSTIYTVYPIDLASNSVITAVADVQAEKTVESVTYYNLAGQQSAQPFQGLNIKLTRYTDGSQEATKLVK